ncbi:MAG: hypothetical protein V2A66_09355 [Pseudomonadota bacterium]
MLAVMGIVPILVYAAYAAGAAVFAAIFGAAAPACNTDNPSDDGATDAGKKDGPDLAGVDMASSTDGPDGGVLPDIRDGRVDGYVPPIDASRPNDLVPQDATMRKGVNLAFASITSNKGACKIIDMKISADSTLWALCGGINQYAKIKLPPNPGDALKAANNIDASNSPVVPMSPQGTPVQIIFPPAPLGYAAIVMYNITTSVSWGSIQSGGMALIDQSDKAGEFPLSVPLGSPALTDVKSALAFNDTQRMLWKYFVPGTASNPNVKPAGYPGMIAQYKAMNGIPQQNPPGIPVFSKGWRSGAISMLDNNANTAAVLNCETGANDKTANIDVVDLPKTYLDTANAVIANVPLGTTVFCSNTLPLINGFAVVAPAAGGLMFAEVKANGAKTQTQLNGEHVTSVDVQTATVYSATAEGNLHIFDAPNLPANPTEDQFSPVAGLGQNPGPVVAHAVSGIVYIAYGNTITAVYPSQAH